MKWIINVFLLALIWLICGAPSCSEGGSARERYEKKILLASSDSIKKAFDVEVPGYQLLEEYEANSVKKLIDFAEYLKIAADTSVDQSFRKQAAVMARKLFISTDPDFRKWNKAYPENNDNTVEQFLTNSMKHASPTWLKPAQIIVSTPLKKENDSTFKGGLSFYLQSVDYNNPENKGSNTGRYEIDIYVIRNLKTFGKEQLRVWDVYLGDIN